MPGLTVNTNNTSAAQSPTPINSTNRNSASSSPVPPPYSPIFPSRSAAVPPNPPNPPNGTSYTYTHNQQQRQTAMRPPAPVAIDYATNPDVLAVSATQSILLLQQRKAKEDIIKLSTTKMRASNEPWEFEAALKAGEIRHENNSLFEPSAEEDDEDDDEDDEDGEIPGASASHQTGHQQQHISLPNGLGTIGGNAAGSGSQGVGSSSEGFNFSGGGSGGAAGGFAGFGSGGGQAFTSGGEPVPSSPGNEDSVNNNIPNATTSSPNPASSTTKKPWAPLPSPQNVYRVPPINWSQYGIIGEPLQGLHDHAVRRPTDGAPALYNPTDGTYTFPAEVNKRQSDVVIAAPYNPMTDKLDKMNTRKGGKR